MVIARRNLMSGGAKLPYAHKVQYVRGGTGVLLKSTFVVDKTMELRFKYHAYSASTYGCCFQLYVSNSANGISLMNTGGIVAGGFFCNQGRVSGFNPTVRFTNNTLEGVYKYKGEVVNGSTVITVDGSEIAPSKFNVKAAADCELWYMDCYENGKKTHTCTPVIDHDGVACIYDEIGDGGLVYPTGGVLTAGPII